MVFGSTHGPSNIESNEMLKVSETPTSVHDACSLAWDIAQPKYSSPDPTDGQTPAHWPHLRQTPQTISLQLVDPPANDKPNLLNDYPALFARGGVVGDVSEVQL